MKVSEHVRATHNQDGAIVLDVLHGEIFRMNVVASHIFRRLQRGFTESQISREITSLYNLEADIASVDVRDFVSALEKLGLLDGGHNA